MPRAFCGTMKLVKNIQANVIWCSEAEKTAQITIDADVYAVQHKGATDRMQPWLLEAGGTSKVIIKYVTSRQVDVPADDPI